MAGRTREQRPAAHAFEARIVRQVGLGMTPPEGLDTCYESIGGTTISAVQPL